LGASAAGLRGGAELVGGRQAGPRSQCVPACQQLAGAWHARPLATSSYRLKCCASRTHVRATKGGGSGPDTSDGIGTSPRPDGYSPPTVRFIDAERCHSRLLEQ